MKRFICFIMALTMVLSLAAVLPINAVEMESEPILSDGQDEPVIQNANEESGEWKEDEEAENDKTLAELENGEEVENNEASTEIEDIETFAATYSSLKEITFSSHSNYENVDYKSIKVQWLSISGAESYRFYGKILDGEPGSGDNETGVMIYDKTVTKRYVTMSKSNIEPGKWIKAYVAAYDSNENQIGGGTLYLFVNNVELESPEFSSHNDRDTVKLTAADEDFKVSWSKVTNAEGYRVIVKALSGSPNPSDNEAGTVLIDKDTSSRYVYIDKSGLHSEQWVKVWVEAYNDTLGIVSNNYIYLYVTIDNPQSTSLTLSDDKVTLNWNDTTKDYVKVSESGFTYQINYPSSVVSSAGDFDYEWIECSQSGSKLYFKATRPNYSDNPRSVEITVISGNSSAVLTVEQKKCGEGAPSLKIKRDGKTLSDGSNIGSFALPQSSIDFSVTKSGIRKIAAQLWDSSNNKVDESTSLSSISLDISKCKAGDYRIDIYASNSDHPNDYWAQRPFSRMSIYFSLTGSGEVIEGPHFGTPPTVDMWVKGAFVDGYYNFLPGDTIRLGVNVNYSDHYCIFTDNDDLPCISSPQGYIQDYVTLVENNSPSSVPKYYKNGREHEVQIKVGKNIKPGVYVISCTATDGVFNGYDGTVKGTADYNMITKTVKIRVLDSNPSSGGGISVGSTFDSSFDSLAKNLIQTEDVAYVRNAIKYHICNTATVQQDLNNGKCATFFFDGCSKNLDGKEIIYGGGYKKDGGWLNQTAVCIVVKMEGLTPKVVFADNNSSTFADFVRHDNNICGCKKGSVNGAATTIDGVYALATFNHNGHCAFQVRLAMNYTIGATNCTIRSTTDNGNKTSWYNNDTTSGNGIDVHYRSSNTSAYSYCKKSHDSTGCLLVGLSKYNGNSGDMNWAQYNKFLRIVSGNSSASYGTTYTVGQDAGSLIIDRSCYYNELPIIFGNDTVSGGIMGSRVATGWDIAREITKNSMKWREEILGETFISNKIICDIGAARVYAEKGKGESITIPVPGSPSIALMAADLEQQAELKASDSEFYYWTDTNGEIYRPGDIYTANEDLYLTAQWSTTSGDAPEYIYEVEYNANGGQDAPDTQNKEEGVDLKLTRHIPHRSGYAFAGWATSRYSSTAQYYPGDRYVKDESVTLYAVWQEIIPNPDPGSVDPELQAVILGDVNNDGEIDTIDAMLVLRYNASLAIDDSFSEEAADVNGDNVIDTIDAMLILRYNAGMITDFTAII